MWNSILGLLAALPLQDALEHLPPLPAGWRSERLELPLSFAPDLGHEGVEELAFAPGMFDPASETWFSYAFVLALEGDVRLPAATLDELLTRYYRGLCSAVGAGNGFDVDPAAIAVEVVPEGDDFRAVIELVEPFVTGAPLTLELELTVEPGPGRTDLFALVSPMPSDGRAWAALRALRTAWREAAPPRVYFNHLYVVPDAATYEAVRASDFLRSAFLAAEERTTVRRDTSYTGTYLYGRETYFEFLRPGDDAPFPVGSCGIAFGIDRSGRTDEVVAALRAAGIGTYDTSVTREHEGEELPWFRMVGIRTPASRLQLFTMEYLPEFLRGWNAREGDPPDPGVSRRAVLGRYARELSLGVAPLFGDVVEVHLALGAEEREHLRRVTEALGWRVDAEDPARLSGPRMTFVLEEAEGPARVVALRLSMARPVRLREMEVGALRFEIQGDTALLRF